ncbi:EAL domain-containing protein [Thiomicrorhabdus cannonii]|uniref:EAL domain-containing protein n=1 Tax=Thiomicrorhabdus cannonii TaxID=2748011 RepID=UPI0015C11937
MSLLLFAVSYLFSSKLFEHAISNNSHQNAATFSRLTFDNMYQIMSQGWSREQLNEFIKQTQDTYRLSNIQIELYRSRLVSAQYGEFDPHESLNAVQLDRLDSVFASAQESVELRDNILDSMLPLQAETRCLSCHSNAKVGDVLGVMHFRQDMASTLNAANQNFLMFFLLLLPLPILIAYFISHKLSDFMQQVIQALHEKIEHVDKVRDLKEIKPSELLSKYQELEKLGQEFEQLAEKLQTIAVDRDILEFEIKLLDKFIITSEVVRDWKEHVNQMILEITKILPMYALFVVFRTDDEERFGMEIFWAGRPSETMRDHFQKIAEARINDHPILKQNPTVDIHHSIANPDLHLEYVEEAIDLQTKSLMLETPRVGGVVGIGIQGYKQDLTRTIVIESILTTLVNVVGSIKAINKYTRDLEYYATRDPLTNLYNRRVFQELLDYEIHRADRHNYAFSLMMIDFDNFKFINDRHGHAFGDQMLQGFARELQKALRSEDVLARYGGDEFCILLPETDSTQAHHLAERVMTSIHHIEEISPNMERVHLTCSIGVSSYPEHAKTPQDLYIVADNMMYKGKANGKDQYCVPDAHELAELYRRNTEKSAFLLQALEDESCIEPHFQPILAFADHNPHIAVHELLMRIRKDGKLIPAGEFIDVAENMGIVHKLDYLLIKKAFQAVREQHYEGLLFINLSPKALILNEFINEVKTLAREYGIRPNRIVFEITERETVRNISLLEKFVRELKFEGFMFAIDDFGSGFSSFHYLKRFPIDYLKIEGEFICNMVTDRIDLAFVESAVTLAKSIGIKTVAEFIESPEVLRAVHESGIEFAQGYFIGAAQPLFLQAVPDQVLDALHADQKDRL